MIIYYLREGHWHLAQLLTDIEVNLEKYTKNEPWLSDYFGSNDWRIESNISTGDFELHLPLENDKFDLENARIIYESLRHLSITQATDERLWSYLTHTEFWKYMRLRWPAESYINNPRINKPSDNIREHYFFKSNPDRSLIRNGIARLWWYGYISYDDTRSDPFELTTILLKKLDITQQLLERSYSRNPIISKTILSVLLEWERSGRPFPNRVQFRELTKHINRMGGVTILDSLDQNDIEKIVVDKLVIIVK